MEQLTPQVGSNFQNLKFWSIFWFFNTLVTLNCWQVVIFINVFGIAESLGNLPKFAQIFDWWRHSALGVHFQTMASIFLNSVVIFTWRILQSTFWIQNRVKMFNIFRWCFKVDYHWFCRLVLQRRHMPWENFISFLVWSKNSELWQAITSAKINVFWWSFFLFYQISKGDYVSQIKKEKNLVIVFL